MSFQNQPFARIITLTNNVIAAHQTNIASIIMNAEYNLAHYQSRGKNATTSHRPKHATMPIKRAAKTRRNIAAKRAK